MRYPLNEYLPRIGVTERNDRSAYQISARAAERSVGDALDPSSADYAELDQKAF